ncbi:hypothetical protein JCM10450v2_003002 [Rhodotorula kratochvilovae]
MDQLGLGLPRGGTPASARKISHSEYIRAIAAADTPLRESTDNTLNHARQSLGTTLHDAKDRIIKTAGEDAMQTPAKRRRSMRDRTPKQVQAVLSERKRRMSASAVRKEHTPGGLLRALSRMSDLPPPTPSEAEFDLSASTSSSIDRRASYIPRRSSLAAITEHSSPGFDPSTLPAHVDLSILDGEDGDPSLSQHDTSTTSAAEVSALLLPSRRLSRAFSHSRRSVPLLSPPPTDLLAQGLEAGLRRDSLASVASVEQGRRAAPLAEDLTRFLVRRGPRKSELERDADEDGEADVEGYRFAASMAAGRFSMGSELGRDASLAPSELTSPAHSLSASRLSLASGFADLSAARLSLPVSLADEADEADDVREEEHEQRADEQQEHFEPDFGGGFDDEDALSQAGFADERDDDEADEVDLEDRIPWADKGKGRAPGDDMEMGDMEEGRDVGALAGTFDWMQAGFEDRYGSEAPLELPHPPPLSRLAQNRQKRPPSSTAAKKPKKQRYTRTGEPVPDLPRAKQKALFRHFLGAGVKMDEGAVDALMDASQAFFASLMDDASDSARRAGRTSLVNEGDVVDAMRSHRLLSSKVPLSSLARQLGVDRELQSVVDGITLNVAKGEGPKGKKRQRGKKRVKEESEEEEDEDE